MREGSGFRIRGSQYSGALAAPICVPANLTGGFVANNNGCSYAAARWQGRYIAACVAEARRSHYVLVIRYQMPKRRDTSCVFRLVERGLVVIEHAEQPDQFMIVRPASLAGSDFRGWEGSTIIGMSATELLTNAPPAILEPRKKGWVVDISMAAAPGPGPVWFREEFASVQDAVDAIEGCFFGNRIDSHNASLEYWYGAGTH